MNRQRVGESPCFWIDQGRSAIEIPTAIKLMATATQEWTAELGLVVCSMDVKHAFLTTSLRKVWAWSWKKWTLLPMLAGAILREQIWRNIWHLLPGNKGEYPFQSQLSQSSKVRKKAHLSFTYDDGVFTPLLESGRKKNGSQDEDWWRAAGRIQTCSFVYNSFFLPKKKSGRWLRTPLQNWEKESMTGKKTEWNSWPVFFFL